MSKGSKPRPFSVSDEVFSNNFDSIFRKDSAKGPLFEAPIVSEEEILRCKELHFRGGYESCKETDTDRTDAAKNRAPVNR